MSRARYLPILGLLLWIGVAFPSRGAGTDGVQNPEVEALLARGGQARDAEKWQDALGLFSQALEKARALHDRQQEANALRGIGFVHLRSGQPLKARGYYEQALPLYRAVGDREGEAKSLYNLGLICRDTGQPQKALAFFMQALAPYSAAGDKRLEAATLQEIGRVYGNTGEPRKALGYLAQALALSLGAGDKWVAANALLSMGNACSDTAQPDEALNHYRQALALYRTVGDKNGEANALTNAGDVCAVVGQPLTALGYLEQALLLRRATGNKAGEADAHNRMGIIYHDIGQPQKALEYFERGLALHRVTGDRNGEAGDLTNVGVVYVDTGQYRKALDFFERALPMHRANGNKQFEANTLNNIASIGQPRKALAYYGQALALYRAAGNKSAEASALNNIGRVYRETGEPRKALGYFEQALAQHRAVRDKQDEARDLTSLGSVHTDFGRYRQALGFFHQALTIQQAIGARRGEADTLFHIGLVYEKQGRLAMAEQNLRRAIQLRETIRENIGARSESRTAFLASNLGQYHHLLRLLLREHKTAQAFALAQKTKGRSLLDLMSGGKVAVTRALTGPEREQEQQLRSKADLLNRQMVKEGVENEPGARKRFAAFKAQLRQAESDLQIMEDSLYALHPDLARKRAATTIALTEVARVLPSDTALLEYVLLKTGGGKRGRDQIALFVLTAPRGHAKVAAFSLPVTRGRLARDADRLRAACADPRKEFRPQAPRMYRRLIAPAARQLAGKKRLIICPDGPLWDVPFAALVADQGRRTKDERRRDRQRPPFVPHPPSSVVRPSSSAERRTPRFLIERFELDYAYSATGAQAALLARADRKRSKPTGSLLVMANPDFGAEKRFGDNPAITGQRPIDSPGRPIDSPGRPIDSPGRPIDSPARPIDSPARSLEAPGRALQAAAREVCLPRGGRIVALPGTQREAEMLKRDFPDAAVYTGTEAQEAVVKREAGKYRYLHFATHGFFNDAAPLLSSIVLAEPGPPAPNPGGVRSSMTAPPASGSGEARDPNTDYRTPNTEEDGFVTAREIFDLDLSAEMVVLSACNTARGEKRSGEGVVGLTWALFVAGSPTQVLSQWSVDDASTATLMERFYGGVTRGQAKGSALRAAELSLLRDGRHAHPYYWAPFVLVGDWRK